MLGLEKIANWWDGKHKESEDILQEWVNNNNSDLEMNAKAVVATIVSTSMILGAGLVDVLRIGEGIKKGGTWGYFQDGLRLLSIAGPIARLGRLGAAKWTFDPGGNWCASIAMAKALRQTGTKLFIRASEVIQKTGFAPTNLNQFIPVLKSMGARVREVSKLKDMKALEQLVADNPKSVIMFGVTWKFPSGEIVGHALYAFRDTFGAFKIADRSGKIVSTLSELNVYYPAIGSATPQGAALIIYNSVIVEGTSLASMLAIEVNAFLAQTANGKEVIFTPVKE